MDYDYFCKEIETKDKAVRCRQLRRLNDELFEGPRVWTQENYVEAWEKLKKTLARTLTDPVELARSLSVELWKNFLKVLPPSEGNIVHLIPIMSRRLSTQELQEPSEEVRHNCVILLRLVVVKYKDHLAAYSDDLVAILARTVADNYPELKRESSACIEDLASSVSEQFYPRSESLVRPILGNFGHQHWKVRAASVRAIGQVLLHGNSKSMDEVSTPLAQRLFDQSAAVRLAVVEVAGSWFVQLRDRYSWWYKLIPLLTTGLHDEIKDIRIRAGQLWDEAGKQYLRENENDDRLKDKIDFLDEVPVINPISEEKFKRPNLGCRVIVQQNLGKLVNGIGRELGDWLVDVRIRSAQLLCVLVLNAEKDVTQHVQHLLPAMYRACNDEDQRVVTNVELAAQYIGRFVLPSTYCPLILPTLEEPLTAGHLRVFAAIIRGSESSSLLSMLPDIALHIHNPDIIDCRKPGRQDALLECCDSIMSVCQKDYKCIAQDLFEIIFSIVATCEEKSAVESKAEGLLWSLASLENMTESELYFIFLPPTLKPLDFKVDSWTIHSKEYRILRAALTRAPDTVAFNADVVLPIFVGTMSDSADPQIRLSIFILLSGFFEAQSWRIKKLGYPILRQSVLPALVWSAGRTAEAIRTAATGCLCAVLGDVDEETTATNESDTITEETANYSRKDIAEIIALLVTLADDNAKKTRLYALRAICRILTIGKRLQLIDEEQIHATYPTVLKRLDDGCDDVRAVATDALVHVWRARPDKYDLVFSKSHVDYLYTTGIVHLDDPDAKFQARMLDTMLELAKIHPQLLATKIENCTNNFRNENGLQRVLERCHELLRSTE